MKILAVDDDLLILELLKATMSSIGYHQIAVANSARAAMEMINNAAEPYDCFLLDIQMPDFDGIELCRWIRKVGGYTIQPIVMITAMSDKSYVDRAFKAGATDYVTKPFDILELGTRVRIAEKQYNADCRLVENGQTVQALSAQLEDAYKIGLADPIALDNVDGPIDLMALENHLLQLSRGEMYSSGAIAFRVAQIERIYNTSAPSLFRDILAQACEAVVEAMRGMDFLLAHAGNGTFVAVVSQGRSLQPLEVEQAVNESLRAVGMLDDAGRDLDIQVRVGSVYNFGPLRSGRGAINQMYKAIEEVQKNGSSAKRPAAATARRSGVMSFLSLD